MIGFREADNASFMSLYLNLDNPDKCKFMYDNSKGFQQNIYKGLYRNYSNRIKRCHKIEEHQESALEGYRFLTQIISSYEIKKKDSISCIIKYWRKYGNSLYNI